MDMRGLNFDEVVEIFEAMLNRTLLPGEIEVLREKYPGMQGAKDGK